MAEPQVRERRRLTKRYYTSSGRTSSFSERSASDHCADNPSDQLHSHRASLSRPNIYTSASAGPPPTGRLSLADPEVGQPFDSQNLLREINNTYNSTQNSFLPAPNTTFPPLIPFTSAQSSAADVKSLPLHPSSSPSLSQTTTRDRRVQSPKLRTSQSYAAIGRGQKMDRITPPRTKESGYVSPRQRYSDEAKPDKKKSVFANLLNGVKSTPRRPTISTPTNPMHVTHVGIDNETGQYTVSVHTSRCPIEIRSATDC